MLIKSKPLRWSWMRHKVKNSLFILLFIIAASLGGQSTARDFFLAGENSFLRDDYYSAIDNYKRAIEINPRYLEALIGQARAYFLLGEYQEAEFVLSQAVPLGSANNEVQNILARIELSKGNIQASETILNGILSREPGNKMARLGQAEVLVQKGGYRQALNLYQSYLRDFPSDFKANLSALYLLDELRDDTALEDLLQRALSYYSFEPAVNEFASRYYLRQGDYSKALQFAQIYTNRALNPAGGFALQGRIYLEAGEYENALASLNNASQLEGGSADILALTAAVYAAQGNRQAAINSYRRAALRRPDQEIFQIAMEETVRNLRLEDPIRADIAEVHFQKARDWKLRNQFLPALAAFQRGFRIWPLDREARLEYASMLYLRGYATSYLKDLKLIAQENPTYSEQGFLDDLEIQASLYEQRFPSAWGLAPEETENPVEGSPRYKLGVYLQDEMSRVPFYRGDELLLGYTVDSLRNPRRWEVVGGNKVESLTQAFRRARLDEVDFYLVLGFRLGERDFGLTAQMYFADSGRMMKEWEIYRSGMDKISLAVGDFASSVDEFLPLMGSVVQRDGKSRIVLINLGKRDGAELENKLWVVREGTADFTLAESFFKEDPFNYLGTVEITEMDDYVSVARFEQSGFFDLLRPGDWVLLPKGEEPPDVNSAVEFPNDLQRSIISIPNRP
jgi:tetratricopeptide (TPR) repeat protein